MLFSCSYFHLKKNKMRKQPVQKTTLMLLSFLCIVVMVVIPLFTQRVTVVFSKDSLNIDNKNIRQMNGPSNEEHVVELWQRLKKEVGEDMMKFQYSPAKLVNCNSSVCSGQRNPITDRQPMDDRVRSLTDKGSNKNSMAVPQETMPLSTLLYQPIINLFQITYKINEPNTHCSHNDTDILMVVPSAPGNFKRRELVRQGNLAVFVKDPQNRARLLFFLGTPDPTGNQSKSIQDRIYQENALHGDVIQATFVDTYKNITKKAALMLHWGSTFCQGAQFFIRTDDDVRVNASALVASLQRKRKMLEHFILGKIRPKEYPGNNPKFPKYYVPDSQWSRKIPYPPFALGGAYGFPMKTAGLLLEAMRRTKLVWLDDVFVTGVCGQRVGVSVFEDEAFIFNHIKLGTNE